MVQRSYYRSTPKTKQGKANRKKSAPKSASNTSKSRKMILNPKTGRMVLESGAIGQRILGNKTKSNTTKKPRTVTSLVCERKQFSSSPSTSTKIATNKVKKSNKNKSMKLKSGKKKCKPGYKRMSSSRCRKTLKARKSECLRKKRVWRSKKCVKN